MGQRIQRVGCGRVGAGFPHEGRIYAPAVCADLEGDGIYEIVAGSNNGKIAAYEWKNEALTVKAGWPVSACDAGQCGAWRRRTRTGTARSRSWPPPPKPQTPIFTWKPAVPPVDTGGSEDCPHSDKDGRARPSGSVCDPGAYAFIAAGTIPLPDLLLRGNAAAGE